MFPEFQYETLLQSFNPPMDRHWGPLTPNSEVYYKYLSTDTYDVSLSLRQFVMHITTDSVRTFTSDFLENYSNCPVMDPYKGPSSLR